MFKHVPHRLHMRANLLVDVGATSKVSIDERKVWRYFLCGIISEQKHVPVIPQRHIFSLPCPPLTTLYVTLLKMIT
jgi:hypothetical protein